MSADAPARGRSSPDGHDGATAPARLTSAGSEPGPDAVGSWRPVALAVALVLLIPLGVAVVGRTSEGAAPSTTTVAGRAPLTAADSSCYGPATSSPGSPATGDGIHLVEATRAAGLCHLQHELRSPPNCFYQSPGDVPASAPPPPASYLACLPERMSGGVAIGDFDRDGRPDVYLTQLRQGPPGALFRNLGGGQFEDVTAQAGLDRVQADGNGALWVDVDNDGRRDLVVTTIGSSRHLLFMNHGDGTFGEEATSRGSSLADDAPRRGFSVAAGDYDHDGYSDLFFTEWEPPAEWATKPNPHVRLLHNRGARGPGTFEDTSEPAGVIVGRPDGVSLNPAYTPYLARETTDRYRSVSFVPAFADLDADSWPDLIVVSDFGTSQLFWNNRDGTFSDGTKEAGFGTEGNGMGLALGDVNRDGRPDVFVSAISSHRQPHAESYTGNRMYVNEGNRRFVDRSAELGVGDGGWGWGAAFADFDHDADLDLVMTNGQFTGTYDDTLGTAEHAATPKRLWMDRGDGRFDEVAEAAGLTTRADGKGLATFDADGDGDLDLLVVNNGAHPTFYRNESRPERNWVTVAVASAPGESADGFGAVVTVRDERGRAQSRVVGADAGYLGQGDLAIDVGLGDAEGPVDVDVRWPATGSVASLRAVPTRTVVTVRPDPR